jgi:hypothetical protein
MREVVPKGSKITFTTETFGLGFFVGQRKVCYIVSVVRDLMVMSFSGGFCVRYFEWVIPRKLWLI